MMWLFAILIVLALGVVAVVAAGKGEPLAPAYADRPDGAASSGVLDTRGGQGDNPLGGDDLRRARFSLALRGYRMSEVDALLARVATELDAVRAQSPEQASEQVGEQSGDRSTNSATTED